MNPFKLQKSKYIRVKLCQQKKIIKKFSTVHAPLPPLSGGKGIKI